jgi:hypothetical protein
MSARRRPGGGEDGAVHAAAALERLPLVTGCVTLATGVALAAAPRLLTGPFGLDGQEAAVRAIGVSDLVLVPGLLAGRPRWPWMVARAAFDVPVAAWLHAVAGRSSSPKALEVAAGLLAGLVVVDGATALALHRARS